jgi:vacuolar-type H+-ATPase subunit D/Vma8
MTTQKKEKRQSLITEVINLENELEHLENKIPSLLKEIQDLNPTKTEIDEAGLQDLFDHYL